jgi:hypothetical protein
MFGVDWNDPQTLWLNITNLALGLVTLGCVLVFAYSVYAELRGRARRRAEMAGIDGELRAMLGSRGAGKSR